MKKTFIFILVIALLVSTAMPAFAQDGVKGPKAPKPKTFNVLGTITAVDTTLGTFTVKVVQSNAVTKSYKGKELTVTTTVTDTVFLNKNDDGTFTQIDITGLVISDTVRVKGKTLVGSGVFTGTLVTQGVPLPKGKGQGK